MITGVINEELEPRLLLTVRTASGQPQQVGVVIDTGFNGVLTLPPAQIAALGLPWLCRQQGELADGSVMAFDVYEATVDWDGQRMNKWRRSDRTILLRSSAGQTCPPCFAIVGF